MRIFSTLFLLFFTKSLVNGTNWYIKQGNPTSNDGLTPATAAGLNSTGAFPMTISPGDIVYLIGVFTNPSYSTATSVGVPVDDPRFWHGENTIRINNLHGNASNYITIKPYDNTTLLKGDGGNIFRVQNSSYLKIDGFKIQGEVDNMPLSVANALQFVYVVSTTTVTDPTPAEIRYRDQDCVSNCTAGAIVDGEVYSALNPNRVYRPTYYDTRAMYLSDVHHIEITNNHIHHMPGGGLRVSDCEDILIKGNEINDCSRRSSGGTHGLVVTKATSTRTGDDYRIKIIGNKVHHNYNEQYSWAPDKTIITPHIDEGKGISLQRNQTTASVNWNNGRILIANNICYYNGFSGIHSNDGDRIDIINNSCYFNSYTKSVTEWTGVPNPNGGNIGISISDGTGHKIINNIVVIDNNMTRSAISTNINTTSNPSAMVVKNNIIYGNIGALGGQNLEIEAIDENTQNINPQFVNQTAFNFNLLSTSLAINVADAAYAPTTDYYGNTRTSPDIGAIEYQSVLPITLLDFKGQSTEGGNKLNWQTAEEINAAHFELERSIDAQKFQKITELKAIGKGSSYTYLDKNVSNISYYRLKMVDKDGSFEYSKVISINSTSATFEKDDAPFTVYPNPFSQSLWIDNVAENQEIMVFDITGKRINGITIQHKADNRTELNLHNLPPNSIYFLRVGETVSKIFKQ
jgi:hypothetical protein